MCRKVVLFELNEVPWRIVDDHVAQHPGSNFARALERSHQYEAVAADRGHLSPWVTWPSLHRGVNDQRHMIGDLGQDLAAFVLRLTENTMREVLQEDFVRTARAKGLSTKRVSNRHALPVVTPVGDEGWAVTTWEAVAGETGWMDARLPSGEVVTIEVVGADDAAGLVVVTLPPSAGTTGYELAASRPEPSDTVYVNGQIEEGHTLFEALAADDHVGLPYAERVQLVGQLAGAGRARTNE